MAILQQRIMPQSCNQDARLNVVIQSVDMTYGKRHTLTFTLCSHIFEWIIDHFVTGDTPEYYDVMPVLPTFVDIDYDPYKAFSEILPFLSQSKDSRQKISDGARFNEIVKTLVLAVVTDQKQKVKCLMKSFRSTLFLDMLDNFPQDDIFYLVYKLPCIGDSGDAMSNQLISLDCPHVVVEFPLLEESRLTAPELEYLVQFMEASCPPIKISFTSSDLSMSNSFSTKPTLVFPKNHLPNLRHITLPNWDPASTLYDFLPAVEQRIVETWGVRKKFVSELQRISAVVEFDPVDFSRVSVSLRLTRNKHFILCIVDLRLPVTFPSSPIIVLIHDALSGASYPLESSLAGKRGRAPPVSSASSASFFAPGWPPERMAREYFWTLCDEIQSMAFGDEQS